MEYKFIGVPMSTGSPYPGTELGCKTFTDKDFEEIAGEIDFEYREIPYEEVDEPSPDHLKSLASVMKCCRLLYQTVGEAYENNKFPVVIGGDHALSIGSIAAGYDAFGDDLCVVWIDAHTDINTEVSTESGYLHGMPLAASMGICCDALTAGTEKCRIRGENIFIIGARSIDRGECRIIAENGVNLYTMEKIREKGLETIMREVTDKLQGRPIHVSLDVDFFDPAVFYATGYNIEDGFSVEDAKQIISDLNRTANPVIFECVEYSPPKDKAGEDFIKLKEIIQYALNE